MPDMRHEIGELWHKVNREVHEHIRHAFRGSELPPVTLILLRYIRKEPGITVGELARKSDMVKSHVSNMVEQLVRQGLVEKRTDPSDQRLLRLFVTQAAVDFTAAMEARSRKAWASVMEALSEEELADVLRGLIILVKALERSKTKPEKGKA